MPLISLDQIGYEPKYYPRVNGTEDWLTVHRYRDALLADSSFKSLEKIKAEHVVKLKASVAKNIPKGRSNRETERGSYGFLKAPLSEFAGTSSAAAALAVQSPVSSRSTLGIIESFIALLESGAVDTSDADVAVKMAHVRELMERL